MAITLNYYDFYQQIYNTDTIWTTMYHQTSRDFKIWVLSDVQDGTIENTEHMWVVISYSALLGQG